MNKYHAQFDIDFRTNFANADYSAKLEYHCHTVQDMESARAAIYEYLSQKIQEQKERAEE